MFQGILGNVIDRSVNQNLQLNIPAGDLEAVKQQFKALGVAEPDIQELSTALKDDPKPVAPNTFGPKQLVGRGASEGGGRSIRTDGGNCRGNLLGDFDAILRYEVITLKTERWEKLALESC